MTIYTVHAPPPKANDIALDPERFEFIRDGFGFWAFVFAPLWMLWRRLWLVLLFYVAVVTVLQGALWFIGANPTTRGAVVLLISLLIGLEAATLRRWTLQRRGWRQLGVVAGDNHEAAERRFFDTWVANKSVAQTPSAPPSISTNMSPNMRVPQDASDIIGLFPEPQSRQ